MTKRAIVYTRVSTDEQKKHNTAAAQRTDGTRYAEQHGLMLLDVMNEDYTGTTVDRPVFNRLLELADAGLVDAVIVQHPDRLGRGHILELAIALLAKRGLEVHACNRGLISDEDDETAQIQNSVDGLVSGIERRNIRRRLTRGIVQKVTVDKKLPASGTAPYGYAFVGVGRERTLVINEEEAQYVRQIFNWYVDGVSVIEISERLKAMRVPCPAVAHDNRGKPEDRYRWITQAIYRILKHTIYAGTFQAFKLHKAGRKKMHETVAVPAPAIVSSELFDRAQARMATGRRYSRRNNTQRWYLLRCRARCGICGNGLCGVTDRHYQYYRCTTTIRRRDSLKQCTSPSYVLADVERTAWQWIEENVLHEDNLRDGIQAKNASVSHERARLQEQLDYYARKLADNAKEAARLKQLYMAEIYTLEEVAAEKRQLDEARSKLEQERAGVEQRIASLGMSADDQQELLETVRALKQKAQNLSDEGKRKILDLCDAMTTLYIKDGQPWMHIDVKLTLQTKDIPIVSQSLYGFRL